MKKPLLITTFIVTILLIAGGYVYLQNKKEKDYVSDAAFVTERMFMTAQMSEAVINLYSKVWKNAIYKEGGYYRETSEYYLKDFNEALTVAYKESGDAIKVINDRSSQVDSLMRKIQDPPAKFTALNSKIMDFYGTWTEYNSMATNPQGSLTEFNTKSNELSSALIRQYKEVQILFPED